MNSIELEKYISQVSIEVNIFYFIINLFLCAFLSIILGFLYDKYGRSLSNRKTFSLNFVVISMTTLLIITIIKQSLALSLGLVGALSIIRFRTAIKEPEELSHLFLCIAIGIGLGANQIVLTIIAFLIISIFIIFTSWRKDVSINNQSLILIIKTENQNQFFLENTNEILKKYCEQIDLKRLDESDNFTEYTYTIISKNINNLNKIKNKIREYEKAVSISFLDNSV